MEERKGIVDCMDELIGKTIVYIKDKMPSESTGHDWWHVERVWKMSKYLLSFYPDADRTKVQLAALLHDLGDYKITGSSDQEVIILRSAMKELGMGKELTEDILGIIDKVSFSKNVYKQQTLSLEEQIVQDADRLDALGAIGIARVFAYGGKTGKPIYDPTETLQTFTSVEERRNSRGSSLLHFDEKLLLLKDMLNTPEARKIGEERHNYMVTFIKEFHEEWECGSE